MNELHERESIISIALFDILGFSNMVRERPVHEILNLYNELRQYLAEKIKGSGGIALAPADGIWRSGANNLAYYMMPLDIETAYFSDTFILWADISDNKNNNKVDLIKQQVFLDAAQWFFCKALLGSIPLRGVVATGHAHMDKKHSIYFGEALVEAAKGERAQHSIGISYTPSFYKYPPILAQHSIPFKAHIKINNEGFLSKRVLNWVYYWENSDEFANHDIIEMIDRINKDKKFSIYYDTALKIVSFARKHKNWDRQVDINGIGSTDELHDRVDMWLQNIEK